MTIKVEIQKLYRIEGNHVEENGRRFVYHGKATVFKCRFWGLIKNASFDGRFYATEAGDCYSWEDGHYMPNTSIFLKNNILYKHNQDQKLIDLLSRSVKVL